MRRLGILFATLLAVQCGYSTSDLQREIEDYIKDKDASIGVAIIVDGTDTIAINGDKAFPMLSVYKLPIALALGEYGRSGAMLLPDSVTITASDLKPDTYTPMRDKYGDIDTLKVALADLLAYSLQQSDNNASDIILGLLPSVEYVNHILRREGFCGINVASTEDEMHANPALCYENTSSPLAMACLLDRFDVDGCDYYSKTIKHLIENCETGTERLPKPLLSTGAVIGHKTGTGFPLPGGGIMAINDAGYVHLPSGRRYAIAVFIADSRYSFSDTEAIIAHISAIVLSAIQCQ